MKKQSNIGGALVVIGLLLMTTIAPGDRIGPYIAVMTAALAAVIAGARLGGYWHKKRAAGDGSPKSGK